MLTRCQAEVVSRTRVAWAREGGARRRYSLRRVEKGFQRWRRAGWVVASSAEGPRHERLVALRNTHPLAPVARQYQAGERWFERRLLERSLRARLDTGAGSRALAAAGFGIVRLNGSQVELRAADPRVARLVNRARLGTSYRGYEAHRVVQALLALPPRTRRRRPLTDTRRLEAALRLQAQWLIDCDDLLDYRPLVRLHSSWRFRS